MLSLRGHCGVFGSWLECLEKVKAYLNSLWSSGHPKNNRILSKGGKKLPCKDSQCDDCEEL